MVQWKCNTTDGTVRWVRMLLVTKFEFHQVLLATKFIFFSKQYPLSFVICCFVFFFYRFSIPCFNIHLLIYPVPVYICSVLFSETTPCNLLAILFSVISWHNRVSDMTGQIIVFFRVPQWNLVLSFPCQKTHAIRASSSLPPPNTPNPKHVNFKLRSWKSDVLQGLGKRWQIKCENL